MRVRPVLMALSAALIVLLQASYCHRAHAVIVIRLCTKAPGGSTPHNVRWSEPASISANGAVVGIISDALDLWDGWQKPPYNGSIYLYSRDNNDLTMPLRLWDGRREVYADGIPPDSPIDRLSLSGDGYTMVFRTTATNISKYVWWDYNSPLPDGPGYYTPPGRRKWLYWYDWRTHERRFICSDGHAFAANWDDSPDDYITNVYPVGDFFTFQISRDGRTLVYSAVGHNLIPGGYSYETWSEWASWFGFCTLPACGSQTRWPWLFCHQMLYDADAKWPSWGEVNSVSVNANATVMAWDANWSDMDKVGINDPYNGAYSQVYYLYSPGHTQLYKYLSLVSHRYSADPKTGPTANGHSFNVFVSPSPEGRYIVFASTARDLIPNPPADWRGGSQIFRYDIDTHTAELVSVNSLGQVANASCIAPQISADGNVVAFVSTATNLDPRATSGKMQVYIRDIRRGVTYLASITADGKEPNGEALDRIALSADGHWLAFGTYATDILPGVQDNNSAPDVYLVSLDSIPKVQMYASPDLNNDGKVDSQDWAMLIDAWSNGLNDHNRGADINNDGVIDHRDIALFLDGFLHHLSQ